MGLFDRFKKKPQPAPKVSEPKARKEKSPEKTARELATERGEPYVNIISIDVNADNLHEGSFELEWNEKFVLNLVRAGYQMQPNEPEDVIVDRWFQNVCRHVVMETWEQEQAMNPQRYVRERDIGGGRKEIS